jgi:hypothetical protein
MRTLLHGGQGTAELHAPGAAEEREQLLPGRNTCFSSNMEEVLTKVEAVMKHYTSIL